jgi:TPR repeat protein
MGGALRSSNDADRQLYYTSLLKLSEEDIRGRVSAGPEEAARIAYAAAVGGNLTAQLVYAQMLLDGYGVERDQHAALRWFGIAATANDPDATNMLGRCYELGWGTTADSEKAIAHYRKAAAQDHHWAQFNLATLMLRNDPSPGEVKTALTLLVRSARQGNAKAMNMIGRYREFGWASRIDLSSAQRWYRRAAEGDCFRGAAHLARLLCSQTKTKEAADWYRRSVSNAPVEFLRDLASHLFNQEGALFHAIGREALRRAAESDAPQDLFAYGHALVHGRGGPIDRNEAAIWLQRADAKGFPGAMALLR